MYCYTVFTNVVENMPFAVTTKAFAVTREEDVKIEQ